MLPLGTGDHSMPRAPPPTFPVVTAQGLHALGPPILQEEAGLTCSLFLLVSNVPTWTKVPDYCFLSISGLASLRSNKPLQVPPSEELPLLAHLKPTLLLAEHL